MAEQELPEAAEGQDAPEGGAEAEGIPEQQSDKPFDVEGFAGRMGWAPKEQWRGAPDDWKPADKFLEDTVSYNRSLAKEVKHLKRSHDRTAQTIERIAEQRIAEERARLEAMRDQAVDEGDRETVKHVTTRLTKLERESAPQVAPEVADFAERHSDWFNVDPEATSVAMGIADNLAMQGKSPAEQVDGVERAMKRRFPELFNEPVQRQQKQPAAVHTADTRSAPRQKQGPKGFADLPAADKEVALRMEKRGRCTRDEYAKEYWQENA